MTDIQPQLNILADRWRTTGYNRALADVAEALTRRLISGGKVDGEYVVSVLWELGSDAPSRATR